jgi:HlyD family secretion protein
MSAVTSGFDLQGARRGPAAVRIPKVRARSWLWFVVLGVLLLVIVIRLVLPGRVTVGGAIPMALRDEASGTGYVRAKTLVGVGARINGVIIATRVDQGDRVRAGQVLAELQNSDAQGQLRQADHQVSAQRAGVAAARANVAAAEARLGASISALEKQRAALRLADLTLERMRSLHQSGIVSKEVLDTAEAAQTAAAREVDAAGALRGAAAQQLAAARSDASTAALLADASLANADVQRANLAYTVVRSPFDGYVVTRDLEPGATVVPGLPIFTIADPAVTWVSVNIDQRELSGLRIGQPATITLRSNPARRIPGTVARIAQQADAVTEEVTVDVAFVKPADVALNETAEVEILKRSKPQANAVPATALVRGPKGFSLWIVREGRLRLQSVETGIQDKRGWIEIARGLEPSDRVVVNPSIEKTLLAPGKRVRARSVVSP